MNKNLPGNINYHSLVIICLLAVSFSFTSCKKGPGGDDGKKDISRLYVSNADVDPSVSNLDVYDPANSSNPFLMVQANTNAKDGNGVFVDVDSDILFQAGRQNKTIYVFSKASMIGANPTPLTTFTDNTLTSAREIAYDNSTYSLFVANNSDSSIRLYNRATSLSGNVTGKKLKLSAEPWGIHFDASKNRLLVLIDKDGIRIEVYNNPSSLSEGNIMPNSVLNIADRPNGDKTRLHGLTYSSRLDVLLVTEIGEAAAPAMPTAGKLAFNADGGIYIFENAGSKLTRGGSMNADRIIYGSNTGLGNPVDVAIDDTNNRLIYAAEKANKKIAIFNLSDNGNKSPRTTITTTKSPESIFLDAREKAKSSHKK